MFRRISTLTLVMVLAAVGVFIFVKSGFCYKIPPKDSNIKYLYVFGKDGKKGYGTTGKPQVIFLKVPDSYTGNVEVSIYDPDVGGALDEKSGKWNTKTRFSIFGGKKAYSSLSNLSETEAPDFHQGVLLDEKTFGDDKDYDKRYYHFSPINASKGEEIGGFRYFKILAEGLEGDDNNVFSLDISPDSAEAFSYELSLRLSEIRGQKMALYPAVPAGISKIIEHNYDLDPTGGWIELISASKSYKVKGSGTGAWADTEVDVSPSDTGRRWVYEITKDRQPHANMAMYISTGGGRLVPVFFNAGAKGPRMVFIKRQKGKPGKPEKPGKPWEGTKLSCNSFTFDASKSYDPDNQQMTYFWDFGDGATSDQIRIMHTYKDAGKYLVKLTVTDNSEAKCNNATTQQVVKVNQPPCAVAAGPGITCVNKEILFDASQSSDTPGDKLTYKWDFGDGESKEGIKVSHKYAKGGDYLVALTVTDDSGTMCDTGTDKLNVSVNTPPVADAGGDFILCEKNPDNPLEVILDASKSKDADNDDLTYVWDFGDGQTAEGKVVTHRYEKGGEYVAKLLVTDGTDTECNKARDTKLVKLNRAPFADAGQDQKICLSKKANFDAAGSYDKDGDTLNYAWDFGDGETAKGKEVSHTYAKGGLYKVKLSVDDNSGMQCSKTSQIIQVEVNSAPEADLAAKDSSCVDKDIVFNATKSSDPDKDKLTFTWDFGDGTTGSGSELKHSYTKGGLYKVTLFVDDGKNSNCSGATKVHYVNVNTPPVAKAGGDLVICVKDEVQFDGTKSYDSDKDNLTYSWDFGDGETAKGATVKHAYKDIGLYKVVLTVTDDSGTECNKSVDTLVATVNAEPIPIIEVM